MGAGAFLNRVGTRSFCKLQFLGILPGSFWGVYFGGLEIVETFHQGCNGMFIERFNPGRQMETINTVSSKSCL